MNFKINDINDKILVNAINNTFKRRETKLDIDLFNEIIDGLENDKNMKRLWEEYQNKNTYSKDISYEDTINAIKRIVSLLEKELVMV